jgi:hypothetical protein
MAPTLAAFAAAMGALPSSQRLVGRQVMAPTLTAFAAPTGGAASFEAAHREA